MWKCHKCGKPVYFAERKQSLGYDWHPECLRCEECGKRLNPGLHAEHKGVPYCHVPCYGALFGPQLFGHGTRVESHKSFGVVKGAQQRPVAGSAVPTLPRDHFESKLKLYNQFFNNRSHEIRCREVNDRLVLEGALRICWGVQGVIHLKEDDDQRTVITVRKRNSCRYNANDGDSDRNGDDYYHDREPEDEAALDFANELNANTEHNTINGGGTDSTDVSESMSYDTCSMANTSGSASTSKDNSPDHRSATLPGKLEAIKNLEWDDLDDLLQVERKQDDSAKMYPTLPSPVPSSLNSLITPDNSLASNRMYPTLPSPEYSALMTTSQDDSTATNTNTHSEEEDSSRTLTNDFQRCLDLSDSPTDDTTTTTDMTSEEYLTPNSTLKNVDYDMFKKQMQEEFLNNSKHLQTTNDGSLKSHQRIDPSRINDSLKLYSENIMSKSFCGAEPALRVCPPSIQYQTLGPIDPQKLQDTFGHPPKSNGNHQTPNRNFALQKSGSASSRIIATGNDNWLEAGINRSKSGPNWFDNHNNTSSDSENCETLKPSTIRKAQQEKYQIRMDCYDDDKHDEQRSTVATMASSNSFPSSMDNNGGEDGGGSTLNTPTMEESSFSVSAVDSSETFSTNTTGATHGPSCENCNCQEDGSGGVVLRRQKMGSTAIKRRSGNKRSRAKLKRRCSINGHFYNRETSFFTPPRGSQMSVWVTSLVNTQDVIQLLLEKYKVESSPHNFALFVVRDNGEQKRLKDDEYPLVTRILMGPHEEVARLFLMDAQNTSEISSEVAQFLNLSIPECRSIIDRYNSEFEREAQKVREKYAEMKRRIIQRMDSLKVRL